MYRDNYWPSDQKTYLLRIGTTRVAFLAFRSPGVRSHPLSENGCPGNQRYFCIPVLPLALLRKLPHMCSTISNYAALQRCGFVFHDASTPTLAYREYASAMCFDGETGGVTWKTAHLGKPSQSTVQYFKHNQITQIWYAKYYRTMPNLTHYT